MSRSNRIVILNGEYEFEIKTHTLFGASLLCNGYTIAIIFHSGVFLKGGCKETGLPVDYVGRVIFNKEVSKHDIIPGDPEKNIVLCLKYLNKTTVGIYIVGEEEKDDLILFGVGVGFGMIRTRSDRYSSCGISSFVTKESGQDRLITMY